MIRIELSIGFEIPFGCDRTWGCGGVETFSHNTGYRTHYKNAHAFNTHEDNTHKIL